MSTLQCGNIHFESTGNNRIQYFGSNTFAFVASGANLMVVNTSAVSVVGSQNYTVNSLSVSTNVATIGNSVYFVANGNVGIGTNTPTYKLDVNGSAYVRTALYLSNNTWHYVADRNYLYSSSGTGLLIQSPDFNDKIVLRNASGSELVNFVSNGNVGIGTNAPKARLHVISSGGTINNTLGNINPNNSLYITNSDGNYGLVISSAGTGRTHIQAQRTDGTATAYDIVLNPLGGNIGIGTTTPGGYKIAAVQDGSRAFFRFDNSNASSYSTSFGLGDATGKGWNLITDYYANTGDNLAIYQGSASTPRMYFDSVGRVLIGTQAVSLTSSQKFEVNGGVSVFTISSNSAPTVYIQNQDKSGGSVLQRMIHFTDGDGSPRAGLALQYSTAGLHEYATGGFTWYTGVANYTNPRMYLDTSGGLGIGITPSVKLHVYANSSYGSSSLITAEGNSGNAVGLYISNANNSTYGTLHSHGTLGYGVNSWANSFVIEGVPSTGGNLVLGAYSGNLILQTASRSNRMIIDSSGRVTKPNQPGFRVYGPTAAAGADITFGSVDSAFSSRYSGWNSSTNTFTAPVAGMYLFTFSFLHNTTGASYARVGFKINGGLGYTYGDTLNDGYGGYGHTGMAMVFQLNAGDSVKLYNEGAAIYGTGYGSFSGFLIG